MTIKANEYINNALEIDNYVLFYTIVTGAVSIDGHRLFVEIKIDLNVTPAVTISTCGKNVSLNDIKGEETVKINLRTIDEAICIVENTSPCIGQAINLDDKVPFLKSEVVDSKIVVVASRMEKLQELFPHRACFSSFVVTRVRIVCTHSNFTETGQRNEK